MSYLIKLKSLATLSEFAEFIGYKPSALSYILYKIPNENKYYEFSIPKKNGDKRKIKAPTEKLKDLQSRLNDILNNCYNEIFSNDTYKKSLAHGFRENHSIITNAAKHKNKRYVFNVDLKDFFPTINLGRVRGFFIKNRYFELNPKIATIIAQIACHDNELPQGSPCSPIISNLLGHLLDVKLVQLAKKSKCTYSRYADDLTFSTNKKDFPQLIACQLSVDGNKWVSSNELKNTIKKAGFILNENKTSFQYKTSRQIATGLVINEKVNVKREYYKQARAMCHELFTTDKFYIKIKTISESEHITPTNLLSEKIIEIELVPGTLNQLEGYLSFIYQIKRLNDKRKQGNRREYPSSIQKLYRKFYFYKHFFSLDKPLLLCEGKTDLIYLKCAMRQLENDYEEFFDSTNIDENFKINFLNWSKNFKDVFSISTGTSGIQFLINIYDVIMNNFKGEGLKFPVIILLDDDDGAKEIKTKFKLTDLSKPFHFIIQNLYVVLIPRSAEGKKRAIEDLFEPSVLETKIEGKSFNRKENINTKTEYGKVVFAEKVIHANQANINFTGFKRNIRSV